MELVRDIKENAADMGKSTQQIVEEAFKTCQVCYDYKEENNIVQTESDYQQSRLSKKYPIIVCSYTDILNLVCHIHAVYEHSYHTDPPPATP